MASPTPQSLSAPELEAPQQLTNLPRVMAFPAYQELLLQGKQPWWSHFKAEDRIIKGETYLILKRLLDITIVVISFPLLLPLLAICALLIVKRYFAQKTDPNGVIIEANTTLGEMNAILGTKFTPDDGGRSAHPLTPRSRRSRTASRRAVPPARRTRRSP